MRRNGLAWALSAALLVPGVASAQRQAFAAAETRSIEGPEGQARVLLGFDDVEELRDVFVVSAYLEIPLPGVAPTRDLEVAVYSLERPWRGSAVSWTSPWNRAGGDLDEASFDEIRIPAGSGAGTLRLNVTDAMRRITMHREPSNGFLLTTPLRRGSGFTAAQRTVLGTLQGAQLVVNTINALAARPDAATIR